MLTAWLRRFIPAFWRQFLWVFVSVLLFQVTDSRAFAGQGAVRMLYTVPNTTFVEKTSGETTVTVNDNTGTVAGLQTAINSARTANPTAVIVIRLLNGATYSVSTVSLLLDSHECLVASGATFRAATSTVTVPLVQVVSGATNVSIAGGTFDGNGATISAIQAPMANRVNVDKVIVVGCRSDSILLKGNGNTVYDNEFAVSRCDLSGSPAHAGISIQNATQAVCVDNYCHENGTGIWLSCAWALVGNNVCRNNTTGIEINGGNDNVVTHNTCNNNGIGIRAAASKGMIVSNSLGGNTTAGISSAGTSNNFIDNLFTAGNTANFVSSGSGNNIVAYKASLTASGQNYFYPPLIDNQHTNPTIVNGMGRTDLTIASTTIDSVQSQYNAARSANPNNVIVLHLTGSYTVGATALTLSSNTCVLLDGTIQINASTGASAAIKAASGSQTRISVSGGTIDGGGLTGNNAISISSASMVQLDRMTLKNFGPSNPRVGSSDVVHLSGGSTPYVMTRCTVNGSSARGIWLQLSGIKSLMSENDVSNCNQDGVDCDSSTSGCVVDFNYCHDLVRYGVFFEQSASHNSALGNICNNTGRGLNVYNNYATPRSPTQYNTSVCNSLDDNGTGIRNGSTGDSTVVSSHNFFFDNVATNSSGDGIESDPLGTENYYSQTYLSGNGTSIKTSGTESFFNGTSVDANVHIQDGNSGLDFLVQGASNSSGAAIVTGAPSGLGNDQWQLIPTTNGYYRLKNKKSGLVLNVNGGSTSAGALMVQSTYSNDSNYSDEWVLIPAGNGLYNIVNRKSGLYLDIPGSSTTPGVQLDQQPSNGGLNQQFNINGTPLVPFSLSATPSSQTVTSGNPTSYTVNLTTGSGFVGPVTFSLSGLPANATGGFTPTSLSAAGSTTLNITTAINTPAGSYPLTVTGTATGGITNKVTVTLVVNTPGTDLLWNSNSSTAWDLTTANWFNEATNGTDIFQTGKNVVFADRPGVVSSVTIASGVSVNPGSVNVTSDTANYTISGAGKITGTGGFSKSGESVVTVTSTNDYTGVTTVSGGVLSVPTMTDGGAASPIGAAASTASNLVLDGGDLRWTGAANMSTNRGVTLTPNGGTLESLPAGTAGLTMTGTLAFSGSGDRILTFAGADPNPLSLGGNSFSGVIADGPGGATSVTKVGANAWSLSATSSYTGGTIIQAGRLRANNSANVFGTGPVVISDGAQAYLSFAGTFPNEFSIAGVGIPETEGNYGSLRLASNSCIVSNTITLTGDARITARGATGSGGTISGQITGDFALELGNSGNTTGVLTLSNAANDWLGTTTISHGTVKMGAADVLPHGTDKSDVIVNNSSSTISSTLDLNGTAQIINGLWSAGSDLTRCLMMNSSASTASLTIGDNDAAGAFGGVISNGTGAVSVTKIGLGTQSLNGNCSYTGATSVDAGVLQINGSLGTSAVTVNSGATLTGNGTMAGTVLIKPGATIAPGNGIGNVTVNNSVTLQGTTTMEVNKTAGTLDGIRGVTTMTYGGTLVITNLAGTLAAGDSFQLFSANSYSGAFSTISPSIPAPGLMWDTSLLNSTGTLRVISPVQSWRLQYFGTIANSGSAADTANPSGDGVPNLMKYSLGMNPNVNSVAGLPVLSQSAGFLTLQFQRNLSATDVSYSVMASSDLQSWTTIASRLSGATGWIQTGATVTDNSGAVTVVDGTAVSGQQKRFLKLVVTNP